MAYSVVAIVIVVAALFGLLFMKNGELAGLGRDHQRGSFRAPHGKLVRTKRLDEVDESSFANRVGMLAGIFAVITVFILGLCLAGIMAFGSPIAICIHFILIVVIATATQQEFGYWRPAGYSIGGYIIAAALVSAAWFYGFPGISAMSADAINMLTLVVGALGATVGIAWMPPLFTYAREFEDGHVNTIQVSSRTVAAKAYNQLLDSTWKPPADRIAHPEYADNPRKGRGGA